MAYVPLSKKKESTATPSSKPVSTPKSTGGYVPLRNKKPEAPAKAKGIPTNPLYSSPALINLTTPKPAGPTPVFGIPQANKPAIPTLSPATANTTPQLVVPATLRPTGPQVPAPKPTTQEIMNRGTTISAPKSQFAEDDTSMEAIQYRQEEKRKTSFDDFKSKLPKPLREGLFGSDLGKRFNDRSDRGLVGFLYGGLTKTQNDQFEDRANKLQEKGIDSERALQIAWNDVNDIPTDNLTSEEKAILRNTGLFELGEKALDSLDFIPMGTVAKKTVTESLTVLKNLVSPTAVEKELVEKIGLSKEVAQSISDDIARATKESDIEIIIREAIAESRKPEAPTTPSLLPATPGQTVDTLTKEIPGVTKASSLPPLKAPAPNQLGKADNMVVDNPVDSAIKTPEKAVDLPVLKAPKPEEIANAPEPVKVAQLEIAEPEYKRSLNVNDPDDAEEIRRVFSDEKVADFRAGNFEHHRGGGKAYYEKILNARLVSETPLTPTQKLADRVEPYKMTTTDLFHGTTADNTQSILAGGFKKGSDLPEDAYRGGGYGVADQDSISFSTDKNIAAGFTGSSPRGVVFRTRLVPGSKVVTVKGVDYAEDLNEFVPTLRKQKVDAVYLEGEKEVVVINPKAIEKIKDHKEFNVISAKEELKGVFKPSKPPLTAEEKAKRAVKRAENAEPDKLKEGEAATEAKKVDEQRKDPEKVLNDLEQDRLELQLAEEALAENPAKGFAKYASRKGGLPEVTGLETNTYRIGGKTITKVNSVFGRMGDDIAKTLGFDDTEEAREAYLQYVRQREHVADMRQAVKEKTQAYNNRKAILEELKKDIKAEGEARQSQINAVKDFFKFNNNEWSRLLKKLKFQDPRLWNEEKYQKFIDDLQVEGEALYRAIQKRMELSTLIYEKEFIKVENLFRAYKFPKVTDMSEKQLQLIIDALEKYKQGDEFFTVRQLETIKNTDIKDIRTLRQAKEKLAESRGVSIEEVENIGYSKLDKYRYDSALAERNPFYEEMVLAKSQAFLEAKSNLINTRNRVNELFGAARKSRKDRRLIDRLIPSDKTIFKWLESDAIGKENLAKEMTAEELEAAKYVRGIFEQARDHLVQMQTLKKYRSEYITHIRRGFLEIWKDDGLLKAFKESIEQYKEEQKFFDILNNDTQQILPLEKFFQYSMRRTGGITPSQNVPKAVDAYFSAFERKKALDSIIPKLDIYANALTPRETSERGLELNRNIKKFTKEWINTKKGRATDTRFIEPGSGLDWGLRTGIAFTRILDLGFSIPTGIGSFFGEQAVTFVSMGTAAMAKGTARLATPQGRKIIGMYEEFVGESTFTKLAEASGDVAKRFETGMFSLFAESARVANMQYLLGNLTKTEWETGFITPKRLAEMQTEMGRWRVVEGATSILGATSPGKALTQYKTWAVPPMMTAARNFKEIKEILKTKGIKEAMKSKQFKENLRATVLTSTVILAVGAYAESLQGKKQSELNFAQILLQKAYRDSLTIMGALDPRLFTSEPRLLGFANDMAEILLSIVALEGNTLDFLPVYQSGPKKGEIKLTDKVQRLLTPASIKQLEGSIPEDGGGGPSKPTPPKPPKPPKPPAPPSPPKPPSPPGR
jgi:hypothetical protein